MKEFSEITRRSFDTEDAVYFRNIFQSAFYLDKGCTLLDLFCDSNGKLVFVFDAKEHKKILPLWMKNKENPNSPYRKEK